MRLRNHPACSPKLAGTPPNLGGDLSELDLLAGVHQVIVVFEILTAHELVHFLVLRVVSVAVDVPPWALKDLRVLERCFNLQRVEVDPADTFDHAESFGVAEGSSSDGRVCIES